MTLNGVRTAKARYLRYLCFYYISVHQATPLCETIFSIVLGLSIIFLFLTGCDLITYMQRIVKRGICKFL